MRQSIFLTLALLIMALPLTTHASSMSESLARMDAIIKEMQTLRAEFASIAGAPIAVATPPAGAVLGAQSKTFFTQSLETGVTNSDIKKIQKLLATDKEIYPYGVSSGFFGPKTGEGIKNFQARFGLDPVGAVGPATKSLFELFFSAYPDDIYPSDVLKKKPTVVASVPPAVVQQKPPTETPSTPVSTNPLKSINAVYGGGEATVKVVYADGTKVSYVIAGDTKIAIIDALALKLNQKKASILSVIEFSSSSKKADTGTDDKSLAKSAIKKAQKAIDGVQNDIDDADSGVDTGSAESALHKAENLLSDAQDALDNEEYTDATDLANKARDKANSAASKLSDAIDNA